MGNSICRRRSKSVVVLSDVNSVYLDKIYEIIKPENPQVQLNSRGKLPRGIKEVSESKDVFSQLLVDVFSGKPPLSIMTYLPFRNFDTAFEINLSNTQNRDDIIFKIPEIGGGSYGSIYLSRYFPVSDINKPGYNIPEYCIGKKTQYPEDANEVEKYNINNSFIEEMLTSILLHESKERMPGIPQVFPKIIGCYRTDEGLVMLMEKLDMTLYNFIVSLNRSRDRYRDIKIKNILIIIAYYIEWLQTNFLFVHRDLHAGNIMLKHEPSSIQINGKTIESEYSPYFIDFGMACVDLSTCCELNNMCVDNRIYDKQIYCLNKSHDLRRLLFSLIGNTYVDPDQTLENKFGAPQADLYKAALEKDDPIFHPKNVIDRLLA